MVRNKSKPQHDKDTVVGSWRLRRNFMFTVSAFAMGMIYKVLVANATGTVAEIIVQSSYWLLFGITALYVFGVTVQDVVALINGYKYGTSVSQGNAEMGKGELETDSVRPLDCKCNVDGKSS